MRVLVTGANGFVGQAVVRRLRQTSGVDVRAAIRGPLPSTSGVEYVGVSDLASVEGWSGIAADVDVVVHAAARVHVMKEMASDPLTEFRRTNVTGTMNLARLAVESGVKRFIYLSSVKVNGERTEIGEPFREIDVPHPAGPYGVSKYEAEMQLRELGERVGLDVVVIRPVLVYGLGVKGNLLALMRMVKSGMPLPFALIDNRRSLVSLDNLVDFLSCCIWSDEASNQTFLISDGEDLSTAGLVRRLAKALDVKPRLFPVPPGLLRFGARLLGKGDLASRLCDSLQVDSSKAQQTTGWSPVISIDEGLRIASRTVLTRTPR